MPLESAQKKRKKPPTFQHLPENRAPPSAKKLKKAWVEKTKIKSKWKAQKRREGIVPLRPQVPSPLEDDDRNSNEGDQDGTASDHPDAVSLDEPTQEIDSTSNEDSEEIEEGNTTHTTHPPPPPPRPLQAKQRTHPPSKQNSNYDNKNRRLHHGRYNNDRDATSGDDKPSLRELFRKGYSRSSLHTYKSDPLKKRRGEHFNNGGGRGGSTGPSASRGRGQPNMKLRMNAVLEKIKRDYS